MVSHPFDVVGYTADADTYCRLCAHESYGDDRLGSIEIKDHEGNLIQPIFADAEFDSPTGCRNCGQYLDTNLTSNGVDVAYEMIVESLEKKRVTDFMIDVADSLLWMTLHENKDIHRERLDKVLEFIDLRKVSAHDV